MVDTGTLIALVLYAFVTSITPGPNNMMLLASGVNFGLARSVPHIVGISIGFAVMVVIVGAGLSAIFETYPAIHSVLRWVGAAYLVYLAWKIATSAGPENSDASSARPMGFLGAAAFQWVNPKAWIMALGAITTYLPQAPTMLSVLVLAVIFAVVNAPCVGVWALFGAGLSRFLTKPSHFRVFNIAMAVLLLLSLYPIISA